MIKGISVNGKHSYSDFGLFIASRNIGLPEKKEIRETVPYMNGFYDFSAINGEVAFGEREISYVFDVAEATISETQLAKDDILDWLLNIQDADIFDDYIPDYYFHGSISGPSWAEEAEQGELTAKFVIQPFMVAREETVYSWAVSGTKEVTIENDSSHQVTPIFETSSAMSVTINGNTYALSPGTYKSSELMLKKGNTTMSLTGTGNVTLSFRREVF